MKEPKKEKSNYDVSLLIVISLLMFFAFSNEIRITINNLVNHL
ncbi:hypothetical protein ACFPU1_12655 [Thalassorhabdus alkalitolerans]|uniref:Uncharacterized protein n=1 Tax=Thalassorhabdus alkalitolerans TaxID=2282697 RepID=A0ABW0YQC2_9BACI